MSGLVLKGDLTEYLGEYLPVPFIDKIDVYSDYIKIKISLLLRSPASDSDPNDLILNFDPLKTYVSMVIGEQEIQEIVNGEKDAFWSIIEDSSISKYPAIDCCDMKCESSLAREHLRIYEELYGDERTAAWATMSNQKMPAIRWEDSSGNPSPTYVATNLEKFQHVDTLLDENSNKIFKYSIAFDIAFPDLIANLFGATPTEYTTWTEDITLTDENLADELRDTDLEADYPANRLCKAYQNVAIFAWTSPYDNSNNTTYVRYDGSDNEIIENLGNYDTNYSRPRANGYQFHKNYDENLGAMHSQAKNQGWQLGNLPAVAANLPPNNPTLANIGTSKISYEHLIKDGSLATAAEIIYVDMQNLPYGDLPIQSLEGKYYKTTKVTHSDIISSFEELIEEYKTYTGNTGLQSLLDNISYILSVYGKTVELLIQLNALRIKFPNQGNATKVGQLFNKMTTRISNFNSGLGRSNILFKRPVSNRIIYDKRSVDSSAWSILDYGHSRDLFDWLNLGASGQDAETWLENRYEDFYTQWNDCDFLYQGPMESLWTGWHTPVSVNNAQMALHTNEWPVINRGYMFFDFEKYLYERSKLSYMIDINKLVQWFGKGFVNMAIVPYSMTRDRYTWNLAGGAPPGLTNLPENGQSAGDKHEDNTWFSFLNKIGFICGGRTAAYFIKGADDTTGVPPGESYPTHDATPAGGDPIVREYLTNTGDLYPLASISNVVHRGPNIASLSANFATKLTRASTDELIDGSAQGNWDSLNLGTEYTEIIPRSFNVASSTGIGDYRLMCFEWQDVISQLPADYFSRDPSQYNEGGTDLYCSAGTYYQTRLKILDRSKLLLTSIIDSYSSVLASLNEYLALAEEICSYNNINNEFNQFFINGVMERYGDNLAEAPWNYAPLMYNVHRDLLENTFNGDPDEVLDNANTINGQIGPTTGTLEGLRDFTALFQLFYDMNYLAQAYEGGAGAPYNPQADTDQTTGTGNFAWHVKYGLTSANNQSDEGLNHNLAGTGDVRQEPWGNVDILTTFYFVDVPLQSYPGVEEIHEANYQANLPGDDGDDQAGEEAETGKWEQIGKTVEFKITLDWDNTNDYEKKTEDAGWPSYIYSPQSGTGAHGAIQKIAEFWDANRGFYEDPGATEGNWTRIYFTVDGSRDAYIFAKIEDPTQTSGGRYNFLDFLGKIKLMYFECQGGDEKCEVKSTDDASWGTYVGQNSQR